MRKKTAVLSALLSIVLTLGFLGGAASPVAAAQPLLPDCNGYHPYAYPPAQNGNVVTGVGGCGSQTVTVELWIDVPGFDIRAACCSRYTSPVTAYGYCDRTGHGNYYTLLRTDLGTLESERRTLC